MKKILIAFVAVTLLAVLLALPVSAESSRVADPYGQLTSSELISAEAALAKASEKAGMTVAVYINDYDDRPFTPSESSLLSSLGLSSSSDCVVLLIDASSFTSYYELFTYGEGYKLISDSRADRILDDDKLYSSIKFDNDYSAAISRFADLVGSELPAARRSSITKVIVIPIIVGILSGGIAVLIVVVRYKKKLKSPIYPLSKYASLELNDSRDIYLRTDVVRTRINTSSGSGGRSGGGRSGGSRGRR